MLDASSPGPDPKRSKLSSSIFETEIDSNNGGERSKGVRNLPPGVRILPTASCSKDDVEMLDEEDLELYITGSFEVTSSFILYVS